MTLKVHISNTVYSPSHNTNPEKANFYHEWIVKQKPAAIEGYPSSLYTLALMFRNAGLELYIPIAFTSSETLLDYQREQIEQQLHTEIFDLYGMTEESTCLHETLNHKGCYEVPGLSINEYLEDGEICTSFINDALPLIRHRSDDVIELYEGNEFGEDEVLIQRIEGRKEDYLIGKYGGIYQRLNQITKKVRHNKAMQMIQDKRGQASVYIVPDGEFTKSDEIQSVLALEELVDVGVFDYLIYLVPDMRDLTYTKRGKFKMVINNITNKKP